MVLVLLATTTAVQAQYIYTTNPDSTITITGYTGGGCPSIIPDTINGLPVSGIGANAFMLYGTSSVTIPASVTSIGDYAFSIPMQTIVGDTNFYTVIPTPVYFKGNAPSVGQHAFSLAIQYEFSAGGAVMYTLYKPDATMYYLPQTANWGSSFSGCATIPWKPLLSADGGFGVHSNQFGFDINWASGLTVVVEASTNLVNASWHPLQTNTLNGTSSYFSDPNSTNYPLRFYRIRFP
jgi:hypothetical protein